MRHVNHAKAIQAPRKPTDIASKVASQYPIDLDAKPAPLVVQIQCCQFERALPQPRDLQKIAL